MSQLHEAERIRDVPASCQGCVWGWDGQRYIVLTYHPKCPWHGR